MSEKMNKTISALKTYLLTGILVTAPVALTFYLAIQLLAFIDNNVISLIPKPYHPGTYLPGIGILLLLVFLILVGMLTANFVGRTFMRLGQTLIERMPIISGVYNAFQKIFETLLGGGKSAAFRQPVLVEYPRKNMWTIAFLTGPTYPGIQTKLPKEAVSVYVPTTPNPTSGFLIYVPKKDIIELDIGVDEALKTILSMGIIHPDTKPARKKAFQRKAARVLTK